MREEHALSFVDVLTRAVRSPMDQRVAHRLKVVDAAGADEARNAAHFCFFRC
jgi:hypothetical protein